MEDRRTVMEGGLGVARILVDAWGSRWQRYYGRVSLQPCAWIQTRLNDPLISEG